jgi:hypothetical protein
MANPTTNYGWPMPTTTDLVTDLPADFAAFGQPVDTSLKALNPETTLGDIAYRSATANTNTRLGVGSTGQVLTVAGGVPTWATPSGGGKVLQVVQATFGTTTSSSSTSYADTGLTANITPSNASNKVLVMYNVMCFKSSGDSLNGPNLRLLRGATDINTQINIYRTDTALNFQSLQSFAILDNPATTSATTYKLQFANRSATASVEVFTSNTTGTLILMEIGA